MRLVYFFGTLLAIVAVAQAGYRAMLDMPYFQLRHVRVVGVSPRIAQELRVLTEQQIAEEPSSLALDVHTLRRRLARHPYVKNVSVEIAYPDALIVTAVERTPAAIASADGFYLVASDGIVVDRLRPASLRQYNLPYVTGIPSQEIQVGQKIKSAGLTRALDMLELLRDRNPELYARFSEINISQDPVSLLDNVTARLRGGMEVRFGDANPVEKLPLLDYFIQQQQQLGSDPFAMAYVDLRVPNQIVYVDKLTAQSLRKQAMEPVLGSMPPSPARADSRASSAEVSSGQPSTGSSPASSSPARPREAKSASRVARRQAVPAAGPPQESPSATADSVDAAAEANPSPSVWQEDKRLRLPFKLFQRRRSEPGPSPVLLAPSSSSDNGD